MRNPSTQLDIGKKRDHICKYVFSEKLHFAAFINYFVLFQIILRTFRQLDISRHHIWSKNVEVTEQILHNDETSLEKCSQLSALNLAHNLFTSIPVVLPCLAINLTRLNMAFNTLRSMSHITSYPSSLKQLDLSHNQITVWPSLPQVEAQDNMELANLACYAENTIFKGKSTEVGGNSEFL